MKKKHVIAFVVELEMTDEEYDNFVQYDSDTREMLKEVLNKQVEETDYSSTNCKDKNELLAKIYGNDNIEVIQATNIVRDKGYHVSISTRGNLILVKKNDDEKVFKNANRFVDFAIELYKEG